MDLARRMSALGLREEELIESYFKTLPSGGKSGMLGVHLFHPASGIRVRCQRERSQGINRFLVRRTLVEKLEAQRQVKSQPEELQPNLPQEISLPLPPSHWGLGE